jgi:hypothetical protein
MAFYQPIESLGRNIVYYFLQGNLLDNCVEWKRTFIKNITGDMYAILNQDK